MRIIIVSCMQWCTYSQTIILLYWSIVAGRSAVSYKRGVDAGRLDRVRLSEVEQQIFEIQRHDPRGDGLFDVASFWKS